MNWTESGTHTGTGCSYEGSGQLAVGPTQPDAAADPPDPAWARLVFELGTRNFGPGIRYHVESLGYHYGDITWTCNGVPRPSLDRLYAGWFDFEGGLYSKGSEFGPGVHTEAVRDDGTLGGVHSLEGRGRWRQRIPRTGRVEPALRRVARSAQRRRSRGCSGELAAAAAHARQRPEAGGGARECAEARCARRAVLQLGQGADAHPAAAAG